MPALVALGWLDGLSFVLGLIVGVQVAGMILWLVWRRFVNERRRLAAPTERVQAWVVESKVDAARRRSRVEAAGRHSAQQIQMPLDRVVRRLPPQSERDAATHREQLENDAQRVLRRDIRAGVGSRADKAALFLLEESARSRDER